MPGTPYGGGPYQGPQLSDPNKFAQGKILENRLSSLLGMPWEPGMPSAGSPPDPMVPKPAAGPGAGGPGASSEDLLGLMKQAFMSGPMGRDENQPMLSSRALWNNYLRQQGMPADW